MEDAASQTAEDGGQRRSPQHGASANFDAAGDGRGGAEVVVATAAPSLRNTSGRSPPGYYNLKTFTLLSSACLLSQICVRSAQVSTITTVQKAFGLTSANIGTGLAVYTAAEVVSGVLVTYFAGQGRTPRILFVSLLVTGAASFAYAAPHFLYGARGGPADQTSVATNVSARGRDVCGWGAEGGSMDGNSSRQATTENEAPDACSEESLTARWTLVLYVAAGAVYGLGYAPISSLPLAYMSDNASTKEEAPLYQGIFYGVQEFGYVIGYLFAAGTLTFYVDLSDVNFSSDDPRWIGAWWVSYVVCSAVNFLLAVPMYFFPPCLPRSVPPSSATAKLQNSEDVADDSLPPAQLGSAAVCTTDEVNACEESNEEYSNDLPSPRMFFPTLWSLIKNPIYVLLTCCVCMRAWAEGGFYNYLPKYLEVMYHQTPTIADLESGVITALVSTLAVLSGSRVVSHFKLSVQHCLSVIVCTYAASTALYLVGGFISCPQYVADNDFKHDPSYNCTGELYSPVCINELSYYSPCHAGCYNVTTDADGNQEYNGCFCSLNSTVKAYAGSCRDECNEVIPYVAIITLAYALPCFASLATLSVILRSVKKEQNSFCIGIYQEFLSLAGYLPSPIVSGELIDGTCLVWGGEADGCSSGDDSQGSCLQYDNLDLRFVMHSLASSMQGAGCVLAICTWFVVRARGKNHSQPTAAVSRPAIEDSAAIDARDHVSYSSATEVNSVTPMDAKYFQFPLPERSPPNLDRLSLDERTQL